MSQENVEIVRAGFAAFAEGDFDRMLEGWDEDAEVVRLGGGDPLRGEGTIRDWFVPDAIDQRAENVALRDCGERVLATCDMRIRGRGSGVEVDTKVFVVFTLRAGKVIRMESYQDEQRALEAAGLSE